MLYNNQELNIISRLIAAGLLEDEVKTEDEATTNTTTNNTQNTTNNNMANNTTNTHTVEASSSNLVTNKVNVNNSIN